MNQIRNSNFIQIRNSNFIYYRMNKDQSDRKKEYAFEGNHCQGTITRILFNKNIHVLEVYIYISLIAVSLKM